MTPDNTCHTVYVIHALRIVCIFLDFLLSKGKNQRAVKVSPLSDKCAFGVHLFIYYST